jgi:hypothetical protein
MKYYSAIKDNEIMLFIDKWMDSEIITLSEISQVKKDTGCTVFSYTWEIDTIYVYTNRNMIMYTYTYIGTYI